MGFWGFGNRDLQDLGAHFRTRPAGIGVYGVDGVPEGVSPMETRRTIEACIMTNFIPQRSLL